MTLNSSNCNCIDVTRSSGRNPLQCACCAEPAQIAVPAPSCGNNTLEQCQCLNTSSGFNCDCRTTKYAGVSIRNTNFAANQCGCPINNAERKDCRCCVREDLYIDAITPSCPPTDTISNCSSYSVTTVVGRVTTVSQRFNCTGELKSNPREIVSNTNLTFQASQCGSLTDRGVTLNRCCVRESILTTLTARTCRVDQIPSTCECPVTANATRECSCSIPTAAFTFNAPAQIN